MSKHQYIAEKPSVAAEFAKVLGVGGGRKEGYLEDDHSIVTWCVGHLVTMSYPEAYDPAMKRWSLLTIPFLPSVWKYEVIEGVKKQFKIVSGLLNRPDVDIIYICTDSGREGEYIYRLVDQLAGVKNKERRRVWIDSQTAEEIRRGIREAKDWSAYDNLGSSAYLRAKEDYLMGINFSRVLTLKFGPSVASFMKEDRSVISVGRVMTCVLGMVVRREREIRSFVKKPFYRVIASVPVNTGEDDAENSILEAEWRSAEGSKYLNSPKLYKENGFEKPEYAKELIDYLNEPQEDGSSAPLVVEKTERKKEQKYAPLLFNLAELQNACSRRFKLSPDNTLKIAQELYEKKMVTYPRTDARVLSSAIAKEIDRNIKGLTAFDPVKDFASEVLSGDAWKKIGKSRYTNDAQITDHYAIIPTGQGLSAYNSLSATAKGVYEMICRRFLSIFYGPAVYQKLSLVLRCKTELFFTAYRSLIEEGYLKVAGIPGEKQQEKDSSGKEEESFTIGSTQALAEFLKTLKKGHVFQERDFSIREGETSPPKRYHSGSLILAMEKAGQLIEDESLREQIKGSGIGTSATRAEIIKKLVTNRYLALNQKTQIITPEKLGEAVYEVVNASMRQMLNPELTASWEKGLTYVAEGKISSDEYMTKLNGFVSRRTEDVKKIVRPEAIRSAFTAFEQFYPEKPKSAAGGRRRKSTAG